MRTFKQFVFLLLFISCNPDWNNPLEVDEDLKQIPSIETILLNQDSFIEISLNYSYSDDADIVLERKSNNAFKKAVFQFKSQSVLLDTSFDQHADFHFTYRYYVEKDGFKTDFSDEKEFDYIGKSIPKAVFTVSPLNGTIDTIIHFDASGSHDKEDPLLSLQIRWDWKNDGTWDTGFTTLKTASHQFSTLGIKTIKLEVKDTDGFTSTTTKQVLMKEKTTGTVTDYEGNVYKTVKIGDQWWMAENLRSTRYNSNDPEHHTIGYIKDSNTWSTLASGAYCYPHGEPGNVETYGLLYNWHAVNDVRGLAPEGWHIPTDEEWKELEIYLGMTTTEADKTDTYHRGTDEGDKLKEAGTIHWPPPNAGATDEFGFTAIPGGGRFKDGHFTGIGTGAFFWTATSSSNRQIDNGEPTIYNGTGSSPTWGMSVRCVKD
ncbi:MAG: hypothetical protein D8M58_03670 [Calditrichaeota bacterium]|nr:MAG: hypothetical protein DWQ03_03405 [Calditrichota bacterium]MBL1204465.1 hypothetical protein [Calditrichota bacterium]NOG44294.1 hypothetical protein [Calditrichota bacterium]